MNFVQRGSRFLCDGYQLIPNTMGWQVWKLTGPSYNILERDIPTLTAAKKWAEKHAADHAKEAYLA